MLINHRFEDSSMYFRVLAWVLFAVCFLPILTAAAEPDRAAIAQAFGKSRPAVAPQPDGLIFGEAEEFQAVENGKLVLIENGIPLSTIIVSDQASSRTLDAALAFQRIAKRMTEIDIPIQSESDFDGNSAAIYIGDSKAVRERGIKVKQAVSDGDHYVIFKRKRCRSTFSPNITSKCAPTPF